MSLSFSQHTTVTVYTCIHFLVLDLSMGFLTLVLMIFQVLNAQQKICYRLELAMAFAKFVKYNLQQLFIQFSRKCTFFIGEGDGLNLY